MKLGVQIPSFTWPGGPEEIRPTLMRIARAADQAGFDSIWVMDHFFQIPMVGAFEEPMLEAYTTLGFLAGVTEKARLGTLVTGVTYRYPGILAKIVTTLDVLSGGRAWLGIGAAWAEDEHRGLGVPFPPLPDRYRLLEDALGICLQMWSDNDGPFQGSRSHLERTLNSPQALTKPHPPILIGGSGERKTLRLVARYADACNLFAGPAELPHKLEVLRAHCEAEGRDYDAIEKSVYFPMDVGEKGENAAQLLDMLGACQAAGATMAMGSVAHVDKIAPLEAIGREVIPQLAAL